MELEEDSVPQDLIAACKHQTTQLYDMMKDNSNLQAEDCMCHFVLFFYFIYAFAVDQGAYLGIIQG